MTALIGLLLWAALLYPLYSPKARRKRRYEAANPERKAGKGEAWVQDEPIAEMFEDDF